MSKRLQVLLDENEFDELRELAGRERIPVSEWVRRALRDARAQAPRGDIESKLLAVRAATRHEFPTADIEDMLEQIDRGRAAGLPR